MGYARRALAPKLGATGSLHMPGEWLDPRRRVAKGACGSDYNPLSDHDSLQTGDFRAPMAVGEIQIRINVIARIGADSIERRRKIIISQSFRMLTTAAYCSDTTHSQLRI